MCLILSEKLAAKARTPREKCWRNNTGQIEIDQKLRYFSTGFPHRVALAVIHNGLGHLFQNSEIGVLSDFERVVVRVKLVNL
jgi:hypothetical protein